MLGDAIEVGVVVQNAEAVCGGDRGDEIVLVGKAVEHGRVSRKLALGVQRGGDDVVGELERLESSSGLSASSSSRSSACSRALRAL